MKNHWLKRRITRSVLVTFELIGKFKACPARIYKDPNALTIMSNDADFVKWASSIKNGKTHTEGYICVTKKDPLTNIVHIIEKWDLLDVNIIYVIQPLSAIGGDAASVRLTCSNITSIGKSKYFN